MVTVRATRYSDGRVATTTTNTTTITASAMRVFMSIVTLPRTPRGDRASGSTPRWRRIFNDPIPFPRRLEEHPHGQDGLFGVRGEGRRRLKLRAAGMGVDQALGSGDLVVDDLVLVVDAIRAVHDEPPHATRSHVHLIDGAREPLRPPPSRHVLPIGEHLEHVLPRRIDDARGHD